MPVLDTRLARAGAFAQWCAGGRCCNEGTDRVATFHGHRLRRRRLAAVGQLVLRASAAAAALVLATAASSAAFAEGVKLRVGHFPNVTHVQALVAHHLSRQGKGW